MDSVHIIALGMGAAWASGINVYAAICTLGFMSLTGNIDLPPGLEILSNPMVLAAAAFMYIVEFFTDKVPGVDNLWDSLHTFIRIPIGALLAGGAVGEAGQVAEVVGMIMGGTIASGSHLAKSGSRVMINTSPEPFSNWFVSIGEDVAVIGGLWTAVKHPWLFLVLLVLFILLLIWLLPRIWRGIRLVFRKIRGFLGGGRQETTKP